MKLPQTLIVTPTFDIPSVFVPPLQASYQPRPPLFAGVPDSDSDGVIDPWDCQPFNPDEDGLLGDLVAGVRSRISAAREYVRPDYGRAARRRQAVRQRVSGGARQVTRTIRRGAATVERRTRPARRTVRQTVSRLPTKPSASRAAERRAAVMGAPKRMLAEIAERGKPFRGRMEERIADVTARQQAKFPAGTISRPSAWIHEQTARVGRVARGFEKPVEQRMLAMEKRLGLHSERIPAPLRAVGGLAKEFGYGVAFSGTAGAVEMAGMVPVGVEAIARRPEILPAALAVGAVKMGEGMWHGATTSPFRMAGEFATFGALMKGGGRVIDPLTPKIIRGDGYTGIGIKGRTKPVYDAVKVPKITRGGVMELDVIAKPPLALKQVLVGHITQPTPIIGLRTAKSTTPSGVTTTYKGIQIGKSWTPAEIIKTHKLESITGVEGTALAMEKLSQVRLGQLRYERTGFARGQIDPGYLLPKGKTPPKTSGLPELMTGERGLTVTEPGRYLPSVDVIKPPKPLKPTRVYAEVKQPYMKAGDMPLAGSPARISWIEAGFRKLSYGVKGGPKQPRIEIAAEPWGYHPTYPPGIAGGTAAVPAYLTGYAAPKRIGTGMYFHPEGAPSSKVLTIEDLLRPKTTGIRPPKVSAKPAKPIAPEPVRPRAEPIMTRPAPARPSPVREPVRAAEPMRAPEPAPATAKRRVTFAEPEASPVLEAMLKDAETAGAEVMQTAASCPIFAPSRAPSPAPAAVPGAVPARPRTATEMLAQTRMPVDAFIPKTERTPTTRRKPQPIYAGVVKPRTTPFDVPSFIPAPEESEEDKRRRRWFIMPTPTPDPSTKPVPDRHLEPYPDPYPDTYIEPEPTPEPEPEPTPTPRPGEWAPPPPPPGKTKITEPPPPPPIILKPDADKKKPRRRKTTGKRKPFEWFMKHEMVTLESFLGDAGKAPAHGKFPEPDLGVPKI